MCSVCHHRSRLCLRLPRRALYPVAWVSELLSRLTDGHEPQCTVDGLRMAAKKMYFDDTRARHELGYSSRPATAALQDAVTWFRDAGIVP